MSPAGRQSSSSPSEEERLCKRRRWQDESGDLWITLSAATCHMSTSTCSTKMKHQCPALVPDGAKAEMTHGRDMSEKQLLQVAQRLGKEWKQVAIYLDLTSTELDDIQAAENNVTMQKQRMLVKWMKRRSGEATAYHLMKSLEGLDDLPVEVHQILRGEDECLQTEVEGESFESTECDHAVTLMTGVGGSLTLRAPQTPHCFC